MTTRIEDGDAFAAAPLNAIFTEFAADIVLDDAAVKSPAFRNFHIPSGSPAVAGAHQAEVGTDGVLRTYTPALNTWTPVLDGTTGSALEIIFNGNVNLGMLTPDYIQAIIAMASVEVWTISGLLIRKEQMASLAIGVRDEFSAWSVLTRTARPISQDSTAAPGLATGVTRIQSYVPMATLITVDDLPIISGVRVYVSLQDATALWAGVPTVTTKRGHLSIIPRRGAF